jgi:hypothetical protein
MLTRETVPYSAEEKESRDLDDQMPAAIRARVVYNRAIIDFDSMSLFLK